MELVRKLKINKLTPVSFTEEEKEILDFVKSRISSLTVFEYKSSIYYINNDNQWILEQDSEHNMIWVRWEDFWKVLERKYKISDKDISIFLKWIIKDNLKCKISEVYYNYTHSYTSIEQFFISFKVKELEKNHNIDIERYYKNNKNQI